jgi:hypothetical protein
LFGGWVIRGSIDEGMKRLAFLGFSFVTFVSFVVKCTVRTTVIPA